MIDIPKALFTLYPQVAYSRGSDVDTIQGFDSENNLVSFDKEAVLAQAQKDDCKIKAKILLSQSDWSALADVELTNKTDFIAYRASLRNLVLNPVENPVFPTEPTAQWSN